MFQHRSLIPFGEYGRRVPAATKKPDGDIGRDGGQLIMISRPTAARPGWRAETSFALSTIHGNPAFALPTRRHAVLGDAPRRIRERAGADPTIGVRRAP